MRNPDGQMEDGRGGHQSTSQSRVWQCMTCAYLLRDRSEVRGHWATHSQRHSVFRHLETGRLHHQTIEGLFERNWSPQ